MDLFKSRSIDTDRLWKEAGRPRSGDIFSQRNLARRQYRHAIRKSQRSADQGYTNDLHEALMNKRGQDFWKCWKSKFNTKPRVHLQIDDSVDPGYIADKFASHFSNTCSSLTEDGSARLKLKYNTMREGYVGPSYTESYNVDAELVENSILGMKKGKAAGIDHLTTEHLLYCHPILPCILAKLFNLCFSSGIVPDQFGFSYTVPLLKNSMSSKNITVDDFRGISINPVISKVFEHCLLRRFSDFFVKSSNQFGFEKCIGCTEAI